ncbi:alpha/beta fold hydrolase [Arthrobacter sp. W4I7]|uniref:alpha/beta fold hydrolase n=1 Tax=Arthrobacter sp. W4I7 TaxID=3042296 RepID=UPI0027884B2C|nr:alpha/beta hydrolase [Arthrobacter sp. W4I7]MDQ0691381.1 pimeloyl-ACP methyl ester carboxylesterase [Arthrobacter sp. W4I7]
MSPKITPAVVESELATPHHGPLSALLTTLPNPRGTIVALHGGGTRARYWDAPHDAGASFMRAATAAGWQVILVDRPGYGASRALAEQRLRAADQVAIIEDAVRPHLAEGPVALVAHSLGSIVAIEAGAGRWQGRLDALALHGVPLAYTEEHLVNFRAVDVSGSFIRHPGGGRSLDMDSWFGPAGTWDRSVLDHFREVMSATPSGEFEDARMGPQALPGRLAEITVPVQLCVGEHEQSTAPADLILDVARRALAGNPRHEAFIIPGGAHNLSLGGAAASFHQAVLKFLAAATTQRS